MKTINLRKFYGSVYKTDTFIELPDEIADALESEERIEHYSGQKIREHTYSIDYSPEIEYFQIRNFLPKKFFWQKSGKNGWFLCCNACKKRLRP